MNILVVSGSQRQASNSRAVAEYIQQHVLLPLPDIDSSILDLADHPALLQHYSTEANEDEALALVKPLVLERLYACDAIVIIAPEWGGMIPPALVNLLLLSANGSAGGFPLGHKPAFAVGVSASAGGSNPISLLKAYGAKNSHLVWLSSHAIIHNVEQFLAHEWSPGLDNRFSQLQSRLHTGLQSLVLYARQLSPVREQLVELIKPHPYGQ